MRKIYLLLLLFIVPKVMAQSNFQITGQVTDTLDQALVSATVALLHPQDSTLAYFSITNLSGNFTFKNIKQGDYLLQINYLGYRQHFKKMSVDGDTREIDLGKILMQPVDKTLEEVIVEGEGIPISIKKDTIEYNASSFRTQPNAVVEELLKKLPGVEVDEDGTIRAQGEQVNKVLVDGKEFFGDDPKIATKNLPAKAVDKVQVFDQKSDMAELTGIDDGQRSKTINLALEEDHKNGTFGNIMGGYGNQDRFDSKLSLNRFNKETQLSMIGGFNNINNQSFTARDYFSLNRGMGGFGRGNVMVSIDLSGGGASPFMGNDMEGYNENGSLGVNLSHDFSKKSSLTTSYFFNHIKTNLEQLVEREYFLPGDDRYFENYNLDNFNRNNNHNFSTLYNLEIDSTQRLRIRGSLGFNQVKFNDWQNGEVISQEGRVENESDKSNQGKGDGINGNVELTYNKRFNQKGRNFAVGINAGKNNNDTRSLLMAINQFYPTIDSTLIENIVQSQLQDNNRYNYRGNLSLTEPLGNNYYLTMLLEQSNMNNRLNQEVYDLYPEEILNDILTDRYNSDYLYRRGGFSLQRNRKKSNLNIGLNMQWSNLKGEVLSSEVPIEKSFRNLLPSVTYSYDFGSSRHLNLRYETGINPPSLTQLQPVADNSNPLNIYIGNPDLQPEYRHNLNLSYFSFSQFSQISFFASLRGVVTENKITNRQVIDELFRKINQPVNTDQGYELGSSISFSAPLNFINSRIRLRNSNNYSREIVFVNGEQNNSENLTTNFSIRLNSRNSEHFEYSVGYDFRRNTIAYSLSSDFDQRYLQNVWVGEVAYFPTKKWAFRQSIRYAIFDGGEQQMRQEIPIWNASISHYAFDQRIEFKASINDILNRNLGITQQGSVNYLEYKETNTLARYVLFSINYSLQKFGNQRDNGIHLERL